MGRRPKQSYVFFSGCTHREAVELAPAPDQGPSQGFPMKCYTFWLFQSKDSTREKRPLARFTLGNPVRSNTSESRAQARA